MATNLKNLEKSPAHVLSLIKGKKASRTRVGRTIVRKRLKKVGDKAPNGQPIEFSRALIIKKGEKVPAAFRGLEGLVLGRGGLAGEWYSDGWCQSHWNLTDDWSDTWGECWDNSGEAMRIRESLVILETLGTAPRAFALSEFNSHELKGLSRYNVGR